MAEGGICKNNGDTNCPICLETLTVPRVLPCQHTFCHKCLTSFIVNHANNQGAITSFSCPVCRSTILPSIQKEDLKLWAFSFPQNATILTLSDESKIKVGYVCDSCLTRTDSKKADGYCVDCNQFFCENCIDFHSKFKILKTHTILTMDELHQNQSTAVVTSVEDHCKVHGGKEIEYFCNDHEALCCVKCFLIYHRKYKSVIDLSSSDNVTLAEESKDILNGLKRIDEHLMKYTEKNKSNLKNIKTDTKQITVDLKKAKDKIVKLFDSLEKEVDQAGDKLYQDENNNKSRVNTQCQVLLDAVRQSYQLLNAVQRMGNKTKLFVTAYHVKAQLANYTEQVVKKYRKLESKVVNLTFHKSLKILLSLNNKMLATVHIKDTTEELSIIGIVKTPSMELMIQKLACPLIENDSLYTSATCLTDDYVMIIDNENASCCLLDSDFQHVCHYQLSSSPWDVCMVDELEVAISLPLERKIQFMAYDAPIKPTRSITTRLYCDGLVVLSKNKVVISGFNDTGNQNYYWSILTTSGKEKTYNEIDQKGGTWTYLAMNKSKTRLFMSCHDIDTVFCFGLDGQMYFRYKDERLVRPVGVGVDVDGNVYVAGNCSSNIHQLSPQGSQLQIAMCKIPARPLKIAFLQNGYHFILTSEWSVECSILRLD